MDWETERIDPKSLSTNDKSAGKMETIPVSKLTKSVRIGRDAGILEGLDD